MLDALLIVLVAAAALACPVMMLLGRRGIGPGCAMLGCKPRHGEDTLEALRARQRELARQIDRLEARRREEEPVAANRA